MCGIVGYIGKKEALPIIIDGLKRLEYRGYDSAGVVVLEKQASLVKVKGRVKDLTDKLDGQKILGSCGIGHCLPPNVLIQLADGRILEISKITDKDKILCLNPKTLKFVPGKVKVFKHESPDYIYNIKTKSGFLNATAAHKMLIFSDGIIQNKVVKDIRKGDLLIFPKQIEITGKKINFQKCFAKRYYELSDRAVDMIRSAIKEKSLTLSELGRKIKISDKYLRHIINNDRNIREDYLKKILFHLNVFFDKKEFVPVDTIHGKFIKLPAQSSEKLMQILGYLLGDGTVQPKTIRFKDLNKQLLQHYQGLINKVFNVRGRVVSQKDTAAYLLEVNSQYLSRWLKVNIIDRSDDFFGEIGKLPNKEIAAFLRGLFDAEGCVSLQSKQITLRMTNQRLVKTVQMLLPRFNILCSFTKTTRKNKNWSDVFNISINNFDGTKKFLDIVRVSSQEKLKRCKAIVKQMELDQLNFSFKYLPFTKKEIYERYINPLKIPHGKIKKLLGNANNDFLTGKKFKELIDYIIKNYPDKKIEKELKMFSEGNIVFQPAQEIKKIKSQNKYLFDIEVSPHANFIADGFLTHNSRWATHGEPSEVNAHPHFDCKKEIFVVHNGILENYVSLKEKLIEKGHKFVSETDTEVIAHLIEEFFDGNLEDALRRALKEMVGAYAIAVVSIKDPGKIVFAKKSSPLLVGIGEGENFIASDAPAILGNTKKVIYLEDNELGVITANDFKIIDLENNRIEKKISLLEWDLEEAEKKGYPHFMFKEIIEEGDAVRNALRGRILPEEGAIKFGGLEDIEEKLRNVERITIIAMGTAYLAGFVGKYMLEEYAQMPVMLENASEFRYKKSIIDKNSVVIAVSQSGETADTLFAVKEAKRQGALTLGIINVVGSSIAREVDAGIYNHAGPEIGVASTKAFISELAVFALLSVFLGRQRGMSPVMGKRIIQELNEIPSLIGGIFKQEDRIKELAKKYYKHEDFFYLGRKYNYPIALEGALKLKEISYIHAEGYQAGEMKHGPIAMIDENFPSVCIVPKDSVYEKNFSGIQEIKARKGLVIAITTEGNDELDNIADDVLFIPKTLEMLTPLVSVIPLQLFAYHVAVLRGNDVDKPRNLAKSVTVE